MRPADAAMSIRDGASPDCSANSALVSPTTVPASDMRRGCPDSSRSRLIWANVNPSSASARIVRSLVRCTVS